MSLIRLQKISRLYQMGGETIHALRDISLEVERGEYVAIMGPSGSGKSTLMNLLGCLDTCSSGVYELNGINVSELNDNRLAEIRRVVVFQFVNALVIIFVHVVISNTHLQYIDQRESFVEYSFLEKFLQ